MKLFNEYIACSICGLVTDDGSINKNNEYCCDDCLDEGG